MGDLDKFNYECQGQISLFSGFLKERCDTKPEIGKKLVFHCKGKNYECVVDDHCGYDVFHVKFTGRKPSDDFPEIAITEGWHISLRGYRLDWDFPEVLP